MRARVPRQVNPSLRVGEERLESLGFRLGIDDLEQLFFAVLQGLRSSSRLLFATPLLAPNLPALTFDICLALSLLDDSRDFDLSWPHVLGLTSSTVAAVRAR